MALKFRRGTTAQQSGSLAFGEPYVNTTLGTLLVGGASGDIQLATAGTSSTFVGSSVSASTFISGSSLKITGNAAIDGNLTLGGAITIGDATADTVNVVASLSSSLVPSNDNVFNIGSTSFRYANVYATTVSASAYTGIGNLTTYSASVASATATSISTLSASMFQTDATQSNNITTATNAAAGAFASASAYSSSAYQIDLTQSVNIATATAAAAGAFASASAYSASAAVIDNTQDVKITSLQTNILSASVFTTFSTSVDSRLDSVELLSASANTAYAKLSGNNTYTGTQTVTGSVYVSGDLVVQGTSSLQNVTASIASIGTNTIVLNTATPGVRFGGIAVQDSGSGAGRSGSLVWDSVNDHWIYVVPSGSSEGYNSAIIIAGPKNSGSIGNELVLTTGFVPVASGDDHITNSIISASLSKVTIQGDLDVTLGISASSIVGLGHVSTYSASVASRVNTIETTYATSASIASATAASISTLSGSVKARTDQTISINGTSVGLGGTLTTAQTLAGAISSSAQVGITATTGYDANKYVDHTGVSISAGSGLSGGGTIAATRTLTLDTASAHFISGARAAESAVNTTGASGINLSYNSGLGTLSATLANSSVTINGTALSLGGTLTTAQTLAGAISSSGQVDGTAIQNKSITINGTSVALGGTLTTAQTLAGAISSSGQVALASTNGFGTYINQALLTTSAVTHGNLTINGTITATGDITAYYTSDKRHKNNIQPITNALQKVSKLNGVTWEWNDDVNEVTKSTPKTGLIAQEVQEVLPEVVVERENGYLGLDYSKMMGLMVEAIKEQQTQIHNLTLEIEELKKQKGL